MLAALPGADSGVPQSVHVLSSTTCSEMPQASKGSSSRDLTLLWALFSGLGTSSQKAKDLVDASKCL